MWRCKGERKTLHGVILVWERGEGRTVGTGEIEELDCARGRTRGKDRDGTELSLKPSEINTTSPELQASLVKNTSLQKGVSTSMPKA